MYGLLVLPHQAGRSLRLPNVAWLFLLLAAVAGCDDDEPTGAGETPVASVTVAPSTVSMHAGGTRTLTAVALGSAGEPLDRPITWTTSSSAIATVTGGGQVIGVAEGSATITATAEGRSGSATVTVTPVANVTLVSVVAGSAHSCALDPGGAAYCWGRAESGQLGESDPDEICQTDVGPFPCSTVPVPVGGPASFSSLAAGAAHTCGLTSDGTAWCWGRNAYGQLGNGTTTQPAAPTAVATTVRFVLLDAGADHTCGLTSAGIAWCWGRNSMGELGDGTVTDRLVPTPVSGSQTWKAIAAGGFSPVNGAGIGHSCAIATDNTAWCWGANTFGQLGRGSTSQGPNPVPEQVRGTRTFAAITAGLDDHTCALTDQGEAWCWGSNELGALGDGTRIDRDAPVAVTGGMLFNTLVAGGFMGHTCGLTVGGLAFCWGDNGGGQLGDGTLTSKSTPSGVNGYNFTSIDAGYRHTCGRATSGIIFCWGANGAGQVGNDGSAQNPSPSRVLGQP